MSTEQSLMTVEQAAAFLQVSVPTIYRWKAEGVIPYRKPRGKLRFLRDELLNLGKPEIKIVHDRGDSGRAACGSLGGRVGTTPKETTCKRCLKAR